MKFRINQDLSIVERIPDTLNDPTLKVDYILGMHQMQFRIYKQDIRPDSCLVVPCSLVFQDREHLIKFAIYHGWTFDELATLIDFLSTGKVAFVDPKKFYLGNLKDAPRLLNTWEMGEMQQKNGLDFYTGAQAARVATYLVSKYLMALDKEFQFFNDRWYHYDEYSDQELKTYYQQNKNEREHFCYSIKYTGKLVGKPGQINICKAYGYMQVPENRKKWDEHDPGVIDVSKMGLYGDLTIPGMGKSILYAYTKKRHVIESSDDLVWTQYSPVSHKELTYYTWHDQFLTPQSHIVVPVAYEDSEMPICVTIPEWKDTNSLNELLYQFK